MNLPTIGRLRSFNYPPILFGMALWGLMWLMLWVSLDVGISKLGFLGSMYEEVRPVFPYAATGLGTFIILAKVWWRRPPVRNGGKPRPRSTASTAPSCSTGSHSLISTRMPKRSKAATHASASL